MIYDSFSNKFKLFPSSYFVIEVPNHFNHLNYLEAHQKMDHANFYYFSINYLNHYHFKLINYIFSSKI